MTQPGQKHAGEEQQREHREQSIETTQRNREENDFLELKKLMSLQIKDMVSTEQHEGQETYSLVKFLTSPPPQPQMLTEQNKNQMKIDYLIKE